MLELKHVSVFFDEYPAVNDVSLKLDEGQWLMLVGPNGAGKSTLINAISRSVPYKGQVLLDGSDINRFRRAEIARRIGVLSQQHQMSYAYTVDEIVSLGRYAYTRGLLAGRNRENEEKVTQALEKTGMEGYRNKKITELSGGEVQRAFLAQVLCQDPGILILDEPANHLDPVYQKQIFELIREWLAGKRRSVISVVHELSAAKRFGTHALLMKNGKCHAMGTAEETLTQEKLKSVYDMDVYSWMRDMYSVWQ